MNTDAIKDDWTRRVYLTWLARDARYALSALNQGAKLAGQDPADPRAWMLLESFLTYTAKVSKTLQPVPSDKPRTNKGQTQEGWAWRQVRGEYLRDLLGVDLASPVLERDVRNAAEHFDEHLDEWVAHYPRPTASDWEQGITQPFPAPPTQRLDSTPWRVTVAGQEMDLTAIENELKQILARATELEPVVGLADPGLATALAGLPPGPDAARIDAPTRQPDEHILAGTGLPVPAAGATTAPTAAEGPHIAVAVVVQDRRVLLVRRRNREGALLWGFPAGKVEPGEAPHDAAAREAREETGLDVASSQLLGERLHPDTNRYLFYVACRAVAGTAEVVAPEEITEVTWAGHADLSQYVPQGFFHPVQAYLDASLRP
ncbi:NUDIX hydrolase [Kitasatospora sp. NPDC087314]|uniref:NUDIX hydrolase n=1 Tax=Kitasatospora sp. NPDC087314 TaxID=3364068 RepID=UPI0038256EF8